jgi:hypothetical protein
MLACEYEQSLQELALKCEGMEDFPQAGTCDLNLKDKFINTSQGRETR